jgi:hypothetical protein
MLLAMSLESMVWWAFILFCAWAAMNAAVKAMTGPVAKTVGKGFFEGFFGGK